MLRPFVTCLAVFLACCTGKDPYNPGTPIGTFHVAATRTGNTCGNDNAPADPWRFDVRLARDAHLLYWLQGGPAVSGTLDAHAHASMHTADTRTLHAEDTKKAISFCAMTREDTLEATLDPTSVAGTLPGAPGSDVSGFTGTLVYKFSATSDSDCSDQVMSGAFAELPCELHFSLAGTVITDGGR